MYTLKRIKNKRAPIFAGLGAGPQVEANRLTIADGIAPAAIHPQLLLLRARREYLYMRFRHNVRD